ncbi:hypothetical protein E2562_036729 [Oryza meyeriana var. granulata]|uniref:Uncharacterized protein n=1 Tax=Oryza meyeriana var. granulata TaxID=110450 RepID=A0A6G1E8F6_9ORYZ|nr:hypothetical protein E2562_036729 [Oryza meyeriana var. granulata]
MPKHPFLAATPTHAWFDRRLFPSDADADASLLSCDADAIFSQQRRHPSHPSAHVAAPAAAASSAVLDSSANGTPISGDQPSTAEAYFTIH